MSIAKYKGWDLWHVPVSQEFPHLKHKTRYWFVAENRGDPNTYIGHYETLTEAREAIDKELEATK